MVDRSGIHEVLLGVVRLAELPELCRRVAVLEDEFERKLLRETAREPYATSVQTCTERQDGRSERTRRLREGVRWRQGEMVRRGTHARTRSRWRSGRLLFA